VETLAQHAFLAGEGCELLQGWLFAPALPPAELLDWLGARRAPRLKPCPPPLSPSWLES
jgi:sensor c-di-GMP phosphodiesterase-like protein